MTNFFRTTFLICTAGAADHERCVARLAVAAAAGRQFETASCSPPGQPVNHQQQDDKEKCVPCHQAERLLESLNRRGRSTTRPGQAGSRCVPHQWARPAPGRLRAPPRASGSPAPPVRSSLRRRTTCSAYQITHVSPMTNRPTRQTPEARGPSPMARDAMSHTAT